MTPPARAQAAIELLDAIIAAAREGGAAADTLIARYFKTRRYAGARDRRAIRDLVFAAIRRAGEVPVSGRAALLGLGGDRPELLGGFDGTAHGPAPVATGEAVAPAGIAPGWLIDRLSGSIGADELPALLDRAPLDLRANRLKTSRDALLPLFEGAEPCPNAPDGLRLANAIAVDAMPGWGAGLFEIQDEGSQIAALACGAAPGMQVVDLCAGAGGKTLALAAAMADEGVILACDTDRARLSRLPPRAARAGVSIVETRLLNPGREGAALNGIAADRVLIDAPCSGTGTWRRNPEARWRLTPERLSRLVATQAHLLDIGAGLVGRGGDLIYVVCSLLAEEGMDQVDAFIARHSGWQPCWEGPAAGRPVGAGRMLTPAHDHTDGFFIARLTRA